MSVRRSSAALAALLVVGSGGLAACSSSAESTAGGVAVTATDDSCQVAREDLPVGPTTFVVKNAGSKVTEVYVYGADGDAYTKVVGEVENIGPGTTRDLSADLAAGTYEIACKPGQKGDGIRTTITVGEGTSAATASPSASATASRTVALSTDGATLTGLPTAAVPVGTTAAVTLTNTAGSMRNLEVKRPDGSVAGEVEVAAGRTGRLVLDLTPAGGWTVIIEGGADDLTGTLPVA